MRVAVVGNCQMNGLAQAMNQLTRDDCQVDPFELIVELRNGRTAETAEKLKGYDFVFAQEFMTPAYGDMAFDALSRTMAPIAIPAILFWGFHPDVMYLPHSGGQVESPLSSYHSAIIAAAFLIDLSPLRTEAMFNKLIYARLGYLGEFQRASEFLDEQFSRVGTRETGLASRLLKHGQFMYTGNHPSFVVLDYLAEKLVDSYVPQFKVDSPRLRTWDYLRRDIWPVYPEIADEIGVDGGLTFISGRGRHISLTEMIEESYAIYRKHRDALAASDRVKHVARILKSAVHREPEHEEPTVAADVLLRAIYGSILERGVEPSAMKGYLPRIRSIRTVDDLTVFMSGIINSDEGARKLLRRSSRRVAKSAAEACEVLRTVW